VPTAPSARSRSPDRSLHTSDAISKYESYRLSFRGEARRAEKPESICVRRAGKEDDRQTELKPFVAVQRVRIPPGKGAARQPEASLARVRQRHA